MRMQNHKRSFKTKSRKIYAMVINNIQKEERMAILQDAKGKNNSKQQYQGKMGSFLMKREN